MLFAFVATDILLIIGAGRMWAENNKDGEKGAIFCFSLPIL
ncbi:MAG TPA: hypothetical protein VJ729_01160 [Nitrososphaeraceae archaeon]|nr:hypothetical protein [Nitrososphaeraceae archaeon]